MNIRFLLLGYASLALALAGCSRPDLAPQPAPASPHSAAATAANPDYAGSATSPQPSATSFSYEAAPLIIRESAGFTGPGPFVIENRHFAAETPEGWLVDIYMPNGQQVILRHCTFAQSGSGDFIHITDNSRVSVQHCRFYGTGSQPIGTTRGRALYAYKPAQLVFEHNYLLNTAGTKVEYWAANAPATDSALRWRYNRVENICGGTGGDYRQALQLQHVEERAGIEVAYNQIINTPNQSRVEDNFNLGESSGTTSSPLRVHHNYVQGAYPAVATASGFTGTGITTDAGGTDRTLRQLPHNIVVEDNIFTSCRNACMNIAAGYDILYQRNVCRVSGQLGDGTSVGGVTNGVSIFKGQPYSDAQFHNNRMVSNDINTVPSAYFRNADVGPSSTVLVEGNTFNTYATTCTYNQEQAAFGDWQQRLVAAQVQVGVQ
jgi:hypothetical protein